ncbi:hypothetical protein DUI87_31135 [Hirundo rustica rustica]|uniref:J domain-containing protein n=1 Tax=Hirundo rustica rustica TaxID=333673 RepID=A0A3M0IVD8_HIRRU|nr:hypothetical protein DUI87_31135 [Hirundo rustica rustica]
MEQPRYRDGLGGSGPGGDSCAAWNGTCGHPRAATSATSPGTPGDDDDESGERDPPVPSPRGVPGPGTVPKPGSPPNTGSVANPGGVFSPEGVTNPGGVPGARSVPSPGSVPNTQSVPTPGGRCGCGGPPAAPPSPSRDIPCALGCRHRGLPEGNGDTRRTRRRPRQRHEEEEHVEDPGDTAKVHRRSLPVARAGVALCLRLLGALLALLLLFFLLLLGALRSFLRGGFARLRRCRELLGEWLLRRRGSHRAVAGGGGEEDVTRLVAMADVAEEELDPFRVLGVEPTASDTELRRAYRRLAVLVRVGDISGGGWGHLGGTAGALRAVPWQVHPDKSRDPQAGVAFKVLRAGWERVSSPERRHQYEMKRLVQGELARALGAILGQLQEELREAMDAMGCTRCGGRHRRFQLDRDPHGARYCASCGGWHAAEEGDLWAESSLLGLKVTYLARMDSHIYDVTEWAGCQRVTISPDSHRVPYHLSFGARTAVPARRQRSVLGSEWLGVTGAEARRDLGMSRGQTPGVTPWQKSVQGCV